VIAGLEDIDSGELLIDSEGVSDTPPDKRGLAMVFQSYALYPHMTVAENMSFALRLAHVPKKERKAKIEEAARILELEPLLDRKPKQLSGGQRQRVAIGRAIVREPKAFLFDEPLSNLDAALRTQMRYKIAKLHRDLNATTIYVTHDQIEAMTLADRIVVLNGGRIEQVGTPMELYLRPTNIFVAGFIGAPKINFLPATVVVGKDGSHTNISPEHCGELPIELDPAMRGSCVTVGIRPENVSIATDGPIKGKVELIEHLGSETIVCVAIGTEELFTAKFASNTSVKIGDSISLAVQLDAAIIFDSEGNAIYSAKGDLFKSAKETTYSLRYSA
jgi:multiple sugar transport system ATP-binding protein